MYVIEKQNWNLDVIKNLWHNFIFFHSHQLWIEISPLSICLYESLKNKKVEGSTTGTLNLPYELLGGGG